ncbi:universal stress protein [Hymenobacter crusticola]|uniref:UspA domain-containing protein n=1 Tax=Hymenobacter crusticola TaxID=1770526 RepID=A0A243W8D2_9BACT|nr:universal stress protein [Hymenobacter crusticola]OUJ71423.1 hypothetical protein BXP70_21955 [Hymenobacter crusticola]
MTPTLLILTDFLAGANRALDYAATLAHLVGARLVLLHVQRTSWLDPERLTGKLSAINEEATQLALNSLIRDLPVSAVAEVGVGRVEEVVQEAVERHHPVLIVLSRPETENTPDELVTTTALNLLRLHACPLLVVPHTATTDTIPQRVLLAADGGRFSLGTHLEPVRKLLKALQAQLTVVHITESATRHTAAQARESVERTGLTRDLPAVRTCHLCQQEPGEGILQAVAEQRGDWLAVIARPHTFLGSLFHHSVTAYVVLHSPVPVLVLPADAHVQETVQQVGNHLLAV